MDKKTLLLLVVAAGAFYILTRPRTTLAASSGSSAAPLTQYRNGDAEIVGAVGQGLAGIISAAGNIWQQQAASS